MTKPRAEFQGLTSTDKYLTVHFTDGFGTAIRFREVKVPITALLAEHVADSMDRAVRRALIERWNSDPLPGLF